MNSTRTSSFEGTLIYKLTHWHGLNLFKKIQYALIIIICTSLLVYQSALCVEKYLEKENRNW